MAGRWMPGIIWLALGFANYADAADQEWGVVTGRVAWTGKELPQLKPVDVNKDQAHCLQNGPIPNEEWVINKNNNGVRWVFVWLAPAPGAKMPIHPSLQTVAPAKVEIDQPCCKFEPHALGMRQGQTLVIKNSSPIAHNTHYYGGGDNPDGNILLPPGGKHALANLAKSRLPMMIKCDIHGWMRAWVRVFAHPYFAVTDADGKFAIKNAPAGDYLLYIWKDGAGYLNKGLKKGEPISIKAGAAVEVKAEVKPEP